MTQFCIANVTICVHRALVGETQALLYNNDDEAKQLCDLSTVCLGIYYSRFVEHFLMAENLTSATEDHGNDDERCPITLVPFSEIAPERHFLLPCLHKFDRHAITEAWTAQESHVYQCPLCRTVVSPHALGIELKQKRRRRLGEEHDDDLMAPDDAPFDPSVGADDHDDEDVSVTDEENDDDPAFAEDEEPESETDDVPMPARYDRPQRWATAAADADNDGNDDLDDFIVPDESEKHGNDDYVPSSQSSSSSSASSSSSSPSSSRVASRNTKKTLNSSSLASIRRSEQRQQRHRRSLRRPRQGANDGSAANE